MSMPKRFVKHKVKMAPRPHKHSVPVTKSILENDAMLQSLIESVLVQMRIEARREIGPCTYMVGDQCVTPEGVEEQYLLTIEEENPFETGEW